MNMCDDNTRLRREFKLNIDSKNFKAIYGTINRIQPNVIYIKLNSWVKYEGDFKDYSSAASELNSKIRQVFKNKLNNVKWAEKIFFFNPELKKIIVNNNAFHASFEFTIKQISPITIDLKLVNEDILSISNEIISIIENNKKFVFSGKKF